MIESPPSGTVSPQALTLADRLGMLRARLQQSRYLVLALGFTAILVVLQYLWLKLDRTPPSWDSASYLETSMKLHRTLMDDGLRGLAREFPHALAGQKAPLISLLPLPFYLLLGASQMSALCVNLTCLLLLSYFLFRLVAGISSQSVACLTVLIVQATPALFTLGHVYLVEYPLTTLVVVFLYALLRSDGLRPGRWTWLCGVLFGLGMLLKITFPVYVIVPVMVLLFQRFVGQREPVSATQVLALAKAALIAVVIAATWYLPNLRTVASFAFSAGFGKLGAAYGSANRFDPHAIGGFLVGLCRNNLGWYLTGAAALSLLILWRNRRVPGRTPALSPSHVGLLTLWATVPIAVHLFATNRETRYLVPALPPVGVLIALAAHRLLPGLQARVSWLLAFALPFLAFPVVGLAYAFAIDPATRFKSTDWQSREIVDYMYGQLVRAGDEHLCNVVAVEHRVINYSTFAYLASLRSSRVPLIFIPMPLRITE